MSPCSFAARKGSLKSRCCCLHPDMARFLSSPLLLLFLFASASATTTISFYQKNSCASDSPSAGDDFTSSNLVAGSGICYNPPIDTVALNIDEIEDGCSSKLPVHMPFLGITALLQWTTARWNHALSLCNTHQSVPREPTEPRR